MVTNTQRTNLQAQIKFLCVQILQRDFRTRCNEINMRGRSYSYSYSPSPPRYGRRERSPSPRGRHGGSYRGHDRDLPTSLLVRNLHKDCRPKDLHDPFGQFGPVKDVYLPRDYYTGVEDKNEVIRVSC
ncbi:hypothetical protein KIW84_062438 [Lathyrus oleraceus]|uniref:RRM domain-containing protein n=1 Tax=Pisum sativum TaxID=3888 RepID=A0A9D5A5V4_PEA|nr:hypothetical protein KIW84_062438 [Pisum sativum]